MGKNYKFKFSVSKKCVGIEQNNVMCEISMAIQKQNSSYELVNNYSFDCSFHDKFNVLLSETLDCAIFGENILDNLIDAKERFMHESHIIIPANVIFF